MNKKIKVLELFAGKRCIGKEFEKNNHKVFSVEWNKDLSNINWYTDIGTITAENILERFGKVDVIWASPDCTSYSIAAISHHRAKEKSGNLAPRSDYAKFCDKVNKNMIKLIKELNPIYYFIENPRGGMRKMDFMLELPRHTVTYCQYNNPLVQELIFNMKTKKCPKCGETKNIDEFYKNKTRKDGFSSWCKKCDNKNHKNYTENNKELLKNYGGEYYDNNIEKKRLQKRKSYQKNKENILQKAKKHRLKNIEKYETRNKEYYEKNKQEINKKHKIYYLNNKDLFKIKARNRKYKIKNISDGTVTKKKLDKMYELQNHKCAYCDCDLDKNGKHLDHIIPISRDGLHIINNVHWVCPKCNLSKGNKLEEEWLVKERMKPTDIWTNHPNPGFKLMCKNGDSCHIAAPRGSKTGTQGRKNAQERSLIPSELCKHIVNICEDYITKNKED